MAKFNRAINLSRDKYLQKKEDRNTLLKILKELKEREKTNGKNGTRQV